MMSHLSTSAIWQATSVALLARNFPQARAGLDELIRRADHTDMFASPESYTRRMQAPYRDMLDYRIGLANDIATQNAYIGRRMYADADFGSGVSAGWECVG